MTHVLVVEDDPALRRSLTLNLTVRGYTVDDTGNGEDALRLAGRRLPDVLFLDLGLPGMSGLDVIRGVRAWADIPDHRALGARCRARQGRGARRRRNRLRHQAVRDRGADGAPARRRADPRRAAPRRRPDRHARLHDRLHGPPRASRRRRRDPPHADRVRDLGAPRPAPRPAWSPTPTCFAPSGGRSTRTRPTTCACTSRTCARRSSPTLSNPTLRHHRAGRRLPVQRANDLTCLGTTGGRMTSCHARADRCGATVRGAGIKRALRTTTGGDVGRIPRA